MASRDPAMPGQPAMDLPPEEDFLRLPSDPVPKPLIIVDAFRVDGAVTADRVAALKRAAAKKTEAAGPAAAN